MDNKEKKLLKNTLLFSVGNAGAKLLMLIIVPFYTYYVSVEQMGQYDVINTYVGLFAPLACMSVYEGVYRWLLDDKSSKPNILKNGIALTLGFMLLFDIIAGVVLYVLDYDYLPEFILLVNASCVYTVAQFITRGLRNNRIYAVQGIIYSVVLITCNVIMVIWLRMQARGLLLSMAVAYLFTTVFMLVTQRVVSRYAVKGSLAKGLSLDLIKYSAPIVPNNIAWWLVAAANKLIINWAMGDAANGIYSISMKFPTLVNTLSTFFYQAWQEQAITEYDSKERDAYYSRIFNVYAKLLLSGIIVLLPVTKFIIVYFMDHSYEGAYLYVGPLYLSSVFNAFAAFYGTGYLSTKKTSGALVTTLWGATANVLLTVLLVHTVGLYAAAMGSMLGNAIIWAVRIIQTRKYFSIRVNGKMLGMLLAASVVAIVLVNCAKLVGMIIYQLVFVTLFLLVNKEMVEKLLGMLFKSRKV